MSELLNGRWAETKEALLEGLQGTVYVLPYFRTPLAHPEMAVIARKSAHLSSK